MVKKGTAPESPLSRSPLQCTVFPGPPRGGHSAKPRRPWFSRCKVARLHPTMNFRPNLPKTLSEHISLFSVSVVNPP
ncbi:hypothetical protein FGO68_gene6582 [Halteria grandinella]|uniref:Uncharacterized protein n=1 Tax=Halteria grandinella TaxID=5974 RepID=A0A8J8N997_HALGN|nr:hypothetical protein FGO68_gene6582 [Halteria grandinella]